MERAKSIQIQLNRKLSAQIEEIQAKLDANKLVENTLLRKLSATDPDIGNPTLASCRIEHFINIKRDDLIVFLMCRDLSITSKSQCPKRGKKQEALDGVKNILYTMAFDQRTKPIVLGDNLDELRARQLNGGGTDSVDDGQSEDVSQIEHTTIPVSIVPSFHVMKSSELLSNSNWVDTIKTIFDPKSKLNLVEPSEEQKKKSDLLLDILKIRFTSHVQERIADRTKWNHWSLQWSVKNLPVVAAYMILFEHEKKDLTCIEERSSLLNRNQNFLRPEVDTEVCEGCYIYFDTNKEIFIRSGKVTGKDRGFVSRHKEHKRAAESNSVLVADSKFYRSYPAKTSLRSGSVNRKGYFDNIIQLVAAGFDSTCTISSSKLSTDIKEGGVFALTEDDKERVKKVKFSNRTDIEKILELVAYQFELGYDLAIGSDENVSSNPGFEKCLGVW